VQWGCGYIANSSQPTVFSEEEVISSSTGKGKVNRPTNVAILQILFNQINIYQKTDATGKDLFILSDKDPKDGSTLLPKLKVDGQSLSPLAKRIEAYQEAKKMKVVDGWIGPSGNTLKALIKDAGVAKGTGRMTFLRQKIKPPFGVSSIKPATVVSLYQKQYKALSNANKLGLEYIVKTAKTDTDITRIRELAYMLATTKHETAHSFRAISEFGKGSGRSYGKEIQVSYTDTAKKTTIYKNKYYGRGYVQLTWGYNYQRVDEKLGNGKYPNKNRTNPKDYNKGFTITNAAKSIYLNPDKALEKENSYVAMVYGMQKGIFTGKKLGDYISNVKTDYINARRVINGTDRATTIANYAEDFEIILLLSTL
jgi:hypothetical protein